jgi:hypothetical protein
MATTAPSPTVSQAPLSSDEALKIARVDAEGVYRDLSSYRICILLEADGWHVDYKLKDPCMNGGGRIISSIQTRGLSRQGDTSSKAARQTADRFPAR